MRHFTIAVLFLITGCSATGPVFKQSPSPQNGQALLYIYRPDSLVMLGRPVEIEVDAKKILELKNNGYTSLYLAGGKHSIKALWLLNGLKPMEISVNVVGGNEYFVKTSSGLGSCVYQCIEFQSFLELIPTSVGRDEIKNTRFQENSHANK